MKNLKTFGEHGNKTKTDKELVSEFKAFLKAKFKADDIPVYISKGNKEDWNKPGHTDELVIEFNDKYNSDADEALKLLNALKKFAKGYPMLSRDEDDDREHMYFKIIKQEDTVNARGDFAWEGKLNSKGYLRVSYWTPVRNMLQSAFPNNKIRLGQTIPKSMRPWNVIISDTDPADFDVKKSLHFWSSVDGKNPSNNMIEYLRPEKHDTIDIFLDEKKVGELKVTPDQAKTSKDLIEMIKKNFK